MVTEILNVGKIQMYPGWLNIYLLGGRLSSWLSFEFLPLYSFPSVSVMPGLVITSRGLEMSKTRSSWW